MAFTGDNLRNPFSGYPRTRIRRDARGRKWYVVDIRYLSPLGARIGDGLGKALSVALFFGALYGLAKYDITAWWLWLPALIAPLALKDLWRCFFRQMLRAHRRVALSAGLIRISGKTFDRNRVRGFIPRPHPWAITEQRRHTHEQRKAQRAKNPPEPAPLYYGEETMLITCVFAGGSRDICAVFGLKERSAILLRLNGINDALNAESGAGTGHPIEPAADTPAGRGGIPE